MITSWENCPGNQPVQFHANLSAAGAIVNKIFYSAYIDVLKEVNGPMELTMLINKCDTDMKKCESRPTIKFADICPGLKDKKSFYYGALANIKPPFSCPGKAQRYVAQNASVDLSVMSFLPVSGFIWKVTVRITSVAAKTREVLMCTLMDVKIQRAKTWKRN